MAPAELAFGLHIAFLAGLFFAGTGASSFWIAGIPFVLILFDARRMFLLVLLTALGILAGLFYYHLHENVREAETRIPLGVRTEFEGVLISDPIRASYSTVLEIELRGTLRGRATVFADPDLQAFYGDLLKGEGTFSPSPTGDLPILKPSELRIVGHGEGVIGIQFLRDVRNGIAKRFAAILPSDEAALLAGLTFGMRSDFSPDLKEAMRGSGTTHLVALSGYNIGLVLLAVAVACSHWLSRRNTLLVSSLFIILFVAFSGASPSILRAAIMGILVLFAEFTGRLYSFRHAAAFAAALMALLDPKIVAGDLGFQLSFLSLLGVVYLAPILAALLGEKESGGWRAVLGVTLGAQIAVLPVIIFNFGGFSPAGIVANMLILPLVPYIMFFGFAIALVGFLSHGLAWVLALIAAPLLQGLLAAIRFFGDVAPPLSLGLDRAEAVFGYYALLVLLIWKFQKGRTPPAVRFS